MFIMYGHRFGNYKMAWVRRVWRYQSCNQNA